MAIICQPSAALTREDKEQFSWSSECEEAFSKVKNLFVSASYYTHLIWRENSFYGLMPVSRALVLLDKDYNGIRLPGQYTQFLYSQEGKFENFNFVSVLLVCLLVYATHQGLHGLVPKVVNLEQNP